MPAPSHHFIVLIISWWKCLGVNLREIGSGSEIEELQQTSQLSRFRTISHDLTMTQRFLTTTSMVLTRAVPWRSWVKGRMKLMSRVNF